MTDKINLQQLRAHAEAAQHGTHIGTTGQPDTRPDAPVTVPANQLLALLDAVETAQKFRDDYYRTLARNLERGLQLRIALDDKLEPFDFGNQEQA